MVVNLIYGGVEVKTSVRAEIVAPDGEEENRREIQVRDKKEYDKLPSDRYPITHNRIKNGIGVTLTDGHHECEASFHRYEDYYFYIGSARRRLGSAYTEKFRKFLEEVGTVDKGTCVRLEFEQKKIIYISKFDGYTQ